MMYLPRFALGSVSPQLQTANSGNHKLPLVEWALYEAMNRLNTQVQAFQNHCNFHRVDAAADITGQTLRHLDFWLMGRKVCHEAFLYGAKASDLAIVNGEFAAAGYASPADSGPAPSAEQSFDALCYTLGLPRIVVFDASSAASCQLISPRRSVDGIFIQGARDAAHASELGVILESLWGAPVLGSLNTGRMNLAQFEDPNRTPEPWTCRSLLNTLVDRFMPTLKVKRLMQIASQREFNEVEPQLFARSQQLRNLRVAIAWDPAFSRYFAETVDLLELHGADVRDFSPLADERLPGDVNMVCLGYGDIERYAADLSANECMKQSVAGYIRQGGRVYAEAGGLAYLCESVQTGGGVFPMIGAVPAAAVHGDSEKRPTPRSAVLQRDTWLGEKGSVLKGYRNHEWRLRHTGQKSGAMRLTSGGSLLEIDGVIGSRLHLSIAAHPNFVKHLSRPALTHRSRLHNGVIS